MSTHILAFDLGGSHVSAALVNEGIEAIVTNLIAEDSSLEETLMIIEQSGRLAMAASNCAPKFIAGIAMAAPGPFDYAGGVSWMQHKHRALYGLSLRQPLSNLFDIESKAVLFLHDATAFLLGEISRCALQKVDRIVGITLGTGIGSAFYSGGKVVLQGVGVPYLGEIYNLPWEKGTVEDILSTKSIVEAYEALSGETISVKTIAEKASTDQRAMFVMEQFGTKLGRVLDVILRDFDPQLIVMGGGITRSSSLFLTSMRLQFAAIQPRIHVCDHLDAAPIFGAAEFWKSRNLNLSKHFFADCVSIDVERPAR